MNTTRRPTSEQRCQEVRATLRARATPTPLEQRRVQAHVANCLSCGAEEWLQARLAEAALASREALPAPRVDAIWAGIAHQLAHEVSAPAELFAEASAPGALDDEVTTPAQAPSAAAVVIPLPSVRRRLTLAAVGLAAVAAAVALVVVRGEAPAGSTLARTSSSEPQREALAEAERSVAPPRALEPPSAVTPPAQQTARAEALAAAELEAKHAAKRPAGRARRAPKEQRRELAADTSTFGGGVAAFRGEARELAVSRASLSAAEETYAHASALRAKGELVAAEALLAELSTHRDPAIANAARLDRARLLANGLGQPGRAVQVLREGGFDAAEPLDAELRLTLCDVLLDLGRADEARACIDELSAAHPRRAVSPAMTKLRRRLGAERR